MPMPARSHPRRLILALVTGSLVLLTSLAGWSAAARSDTHVLLQACPAITGLRTRQVIMSGVSMGGEITTAEIEAYKGDFAGAMPYCGVLAGNSLFDFFLGANVTAAALTGTTISYPA